LIDYLRGRDDIPRQRGVRTSPYIRAVDHMENVISALARGLSSRARLQALGFGRDAPRIPAALHKDVVRLRDMIEHADDRLTKGSTRPSRQPFKDQEPYALRLENDWGWMGDWKIDYRDLVTLITYLYEFIELLRGSRGLAMTIRRASLEPRSRSSEPHLLNRERTCMARTTFGSCPASPSATRAEGGA
jgi:hypothetical protein